MKKSAKEFWKERFGEYPQTDAEKLAVAMMQEYAQTAIAEHEANKPDSITVKALRKKGTDKWYRGFEGDWIEVHQPDTYPITINRNMRWKSPLPKDAELVKIECRIVEPE